MCTDGSLWTTATTEFRMEIGLRVGGTGDVGFLPSESMPFGCPRGPPSASPAWALHFFSSPTTRARCSGTMQSTQMRANDVPTASSMSVWCTALTPPGPFPIHLRVIDEPGRLLWAVFLSDGGAPKGGGVHPVLFIRTSGRWPGRSGGRGLSTKGPSGSVGICPEVISANVWHTNLS